MARKKKKDVTFVERRCLCTSEITEAIRTKSQILIAGRVDVRNCGRYSKETGGKLGGFFLPAGGRRAMDEVSAWEENQYPPA